MYHNSIGSKFKLLAQSHPLFFKNFQPESFYNIGWLLTDAFMMSFLPEVGRRWGIARPATDGVGDPLAEDIRAETVARREEIAAGQIGTSDIAKRDARKYLFINSGV